MGSAVLKLSVGDGGGQEGAERRLRPTYDLTHDGSDAQFVYLTAFFKFSQFSMDEVKGRDSNERKSLDC